MLKAVVFDLDGVLADTEEFSFAASREALKKLGIKLKGVDQRFIGMSDKNIVQTLASEQNKQVNTEEYVKDIDEAYMRIAKGRLTPLIGITKLLKQLKTNGITIGLASSGSVKKVGFSLDELKLAKFFPIRVTGSDVHSSKPHPEIYQIAAKKLGVEPSECVAVEDATTGVESAKRAGMKCVAITSSFPKAELHNTDLVVDSFEELNIEKLRGLFE